MPAAVLLSARRVAEVVLLAQLVGDARGRGVEIARIADDLGAPAAVVGHVAERHDVDTIVIRIAAAVPAVAAAAASSARRLPRVDGRRSAEWAWRTGKRTWRRAL